MKISTLFQDTGRSFTKSTQKQRKLLRSLNNIEEIDISEIERTDSIKKFIASNLKEETIKAKGFRDVQTICFA